jgi:hypothetical protein
LNNSNSIGSLIIWHLGPGRPIAPQRAQAIKPDDDVPPPRANYRSPRGETSVSLIAAMLLMQAWARRGNPAQRPEQEGGARRVARTSAAMEAVMARKLDAFATPGAHSVGGGADIAPPCGSDVYIKSL